MKCSKLLPVLTACLTTGTLFADRTINGNYKLQADADWTADGVVTVATGATIDLNGHTLRVKSIVGDGYVTDLSNDVAPSIAPEYAKLQYIESTTAGLQYIDTGYCHNETTEAAIMFRYPQLNTDNGQCWYSYFGGGGRDNSWSFGGWMWHDGAKNHTHWFSLGTGTGSNGEGKGPGAAAGVVYRAYIKKHKGDNSYIANEANTSALQPWGTSRVLSVGWGDQTPVTAYLFGHHNLDGSLYNVGYRGVAIYFCQIKDHGELVRDYVPVRRLTDGAVGMYDKTSGTFCRNANTGADFVPGTILENAPASDEDVAAAGSLVVVVDDELSTSTLPFLRGKMKLVKAGAGTLVADRAGLAHTCGTEILEGTVSCGLTGYATLGATGSTVTVGTNATAAAALDLNGHPGFTDYTFVLAGGVLKNTANVPSPHQTAQLKCIRLTADSTMHAEKSFGIVAGTTTATTLDLGGHTLTKTGGSVLYIDRCTATSEGRIVCVSGHLECWYGASDLSKATLEMGADAQLRIHSNASPFLLGGYVAKTAAVDTDRGFTGTLKVFGMFRPETVFFHGCELQNGARLDLSALDGTLPARGSQALNGTNYQQCDMTFASDVESVTVYTGERELYAGQRLVAWTDAQRPAALAEFSLECAGATPEERELWVKTKTDGLDVVTTTVPAFAEWDADANDGEGAWNYFKQDGTPYPNEWEGGVDSSITVRFASWDEYCAIKAMAGLAPAGYLMKETFSTPDGVATLDLTDAFAFDITAHATIDAGANTVILPAALMGGEMPFVVTGAEGGALVVDVADGDVKTNSSVAISGGLKLVKKGGGTLIAAKTGQTYTGGTEILAGEIKADNTGEKSLMGANGTPVRISSGGVFDINGKVNFCFNEFVLNGGTLRNSAGIKNANSSMTIEKVRLEADSTIDAVNSFGLITGNYGATKLDLAGHVLTKTGAGSFYLVNVSDTEEGGLMVAETGGFEVWKNSVCDLRHTSFRLAGNARLRAVQGSIRVRDYEVETTDIDTDTGFTGAMYVHGAFRPKSQYYRGAQLQNDATLDLSGFSGTFYTVGTDTGYKNVTFASGAAIELSLAGRSDLSDLYRENRYVVEWNDATKPAEDVSFTLDAATKARGFGIKRDEHGIWLYDRGLKVILR